MPRPYPPEFRFRAVALVRAGKPITTAATELGISAGALHNWVRQDQIDRGKRPGVATLESAALAKANRRIRQGTMMESFWSSMQIEVRTEHRPVDTSVPTGRV